MEWVIPGQVASVGKVEISGSAIQDAVAKLTRGIEGYIDLLTFGARLNLTNCWDEDYAKEERGNVALGWSPIKDRSHVILHRLAESPLRGRPVALHHSLFKWC